MKKLISGLDLWGCIALILLSVFQACGNQSRVNDDNTDKDIVVENLNFDVSNTDDIFNQQNQINESEFIDAGHHDKNSDYIWNNSEIQRIQLNGNNISGNSNGVSVQNNKIIITSEGTYELSGSLPEGQIIVDTEDEEIVRIILNSADIYCNNSAPIFIKAASKVMIYLPEKTENFLSGGEVFEFSDGENEPNAVVFSKSDLTLFGEGTLHVNSSFNDGISSKDGLIITSGNLKINAPDDGIRGKNYIVVKQGNLDITAGGDGLKSDRQEEEKTGNIEIFDGEFIINSEGDAISSSGNIHIEKGEFNLKTGDSGGSRNIYETTSSKGVKAGLDLIIEKGTFNITSTDDAIHSNQGITINGGLYEISTNNDGIHADADLVFNGGDIVIVRSYEGIESANGNIIINKGNINLLSSDDGINLAAGGDRMGGFGGRGGGRGFSPAPGTNMPGDAGDATDKKLIIHGGNILINANGDGIDVNNSVEMTNGVLIIDGPMSSMNGAIDYNRSFDLSGGLIVAAGSSRMAQAPGSSSSQYSVMMNFNSTQSSGTLVHLQTSDGDEIVTYKSEKGFQSLVISSPLFRQGASYDLYLGGNTSGKYNNGIYEGGSYSPGTKYTSFTINNIVTRVR